MKEFVEELIKQLEERIEENVGWGDDEFFDGQNSAFEWTISVIKKLEEEYLKSGKCMNDYEHYDNCSDYIYSKGYNKAIDDLLKQVQFEEKWLFDTGTRSQDVKIAFSGIYIEAKRLKS